MTKENEWINKAVASRVIGWEIDPANYPIGWNPAERIDHAWMVVEKLNSDGGCFGVIYDDFGNWACVSDGMQPASAKYEGDCMFSVETWQWADTAPMAICVAALEAVEEK